MNNERRYMEPKREPRTIYELDSETLSEVLDRKLTDLMEERFFNRFEGITIPSKIACRIINISNPTMHVYIKAGLLVPEDRVNHGDIYFSLSQILKFNKTEAYRQIRYRNSNITKL